MNFQHILLLFVIAGLLYVGFRPGPSLSPMTFQSVHGKTVTIPAPPGRPILLKISSVSCFPCIVDMPRTRQFLNGPGKDFNLGFFSVFLYDDQKAVQALSHKMNIRYTMVSYDLLGEAGLPLVRFLGKIGGTPSYFLISPKGKVVWRHNGSIDFRSLAAKLHSI